MAETEVGSKYRWARLLFGLGAVLVGLASSNAALGSSTGNASINLTKTAGKAAVTPALGVRISADKADALPSDHITYTATVSNSATQLAVSGALKAANNGDITATVAAYWDDVEYFSSAKGKWIPLGGFAAASPGYTFVVPPPTTSGMALKASPLPASGVTYPGSGDPILGTGITRGATASWTYKATLSLTPAQVATLDTASAPSLRNVAHYEVTPRATKQGQPFTYMADFATPFPASSPAATNVAVTITPPTGAPVQITKAAVPGLASIAPGGSVTVTAPYTVPAIPAKGSSESDSAYLTRLLSIDRSTLQATASAAATGASGPISASAPTPATTTEHVPIVNITKSGPSSVSPGTNATYTLGLSNIGSATAIGFALTDTLPDGTTGSITGTPSTLGSGASGTAQSTLPIGATQPSGPLTDTAGVSWKDGNGNTYGPVSSSFTTQVAQVVSRFAGSILRLAPQRALAVTGTTQALTATLVDAQGNPLANQTVTFSTSGANSASGSAVTDANGHATFSYAGANNGSDTVTATFTPSDWKDSAAGTIVWSSPSATVSVTPAQGRFFAESSSQTSFVANPGDTPVFGQIFPQIDLNPLPGSVRGQKAAVDPTTRPLTDVLTDQSGDYSGTLPARSNTSTAAAGLDSLSSFDAVFTADFVVTKPGDQTFNVVADDGFLLGVGGGAVPVTGPNVNPPNSGTTPFQNYPVVASYNQLDHSSTPATYTVTIHFPSAGTYPYELDYFSQTGHQLSLAMVAPAPNVSPSGAGTFYVTERHTPTQSIAKVTVNANGQATVDPTFGSPALAASFGPDSLLFDHHGDIVSSSPNYPDPSNCGFQCGVISLINPTTGGIITRQINNTYVPGLADIALDPNNDSLVGIGNDTGFIARIDLSTGVTNLQFLTSFTLGGVVFTPDGRLYVDTHAGFVYQLNPQTLQPILQLSTPPNDDGMAYDPTTGHLFVTQCFTSGCTGLLEVDPGTASNPKLALIARYGNVSGDGVAADGDGHIYVVGNDSIYQFNETDHSVQQIATGIPGADDVAPVSAGGAPAVTQPLPTAVTLTLSPSSASGDLVGQNQTLDVTANDAAGNPVANLPVSIWITGANATQLSGTTDNDGQARLVYAGTQNGTDTAQATALISGLRTFSNTTNVIWAGAIPPTTHGSQPPSITDIQPPAGGIIDTATPVTATITPAGSDTIASWSVTLQPTGGGAPSTLSSGSGSPPQTLATIDPAQVAVGDYTLNVNATSSSGGSLSVAGDVDVVPLPSPAPPTNVGPTPPTITDIQPSDASIIGTPSPVTATITPAPGDSIASYSVTLQPTTGGPTTTVATGEAATSTLATIEPGAFPNGSYALTITATAASGSSVADTSYVDLESSSAGDVVPAPTATAFAQQTNYPQGQPISFSVVVTNATEHTCQLTTSPTAIAVTGLDLNGQAQSFAESSVDTNATIDTSGSFQDVAPGQSLTIPVSGFADPEIQNTSALETLDLPDGFAQDWALAQPGAYSLYLSYVPGLVAGGSDPCPGYSAQTELNFTVTPSGTSLTNHSLPASVHANRAQNRSRRRARFSVLPGFEPPARHAVSDALASQPPPIPSYLHFLDSAAQDSFNVCYPTFYSAVVTPYPGYVLSALSDLIGPTGSYDSAYSIAIATAGGRFDPFPNKPRSITYVRKGFARILWLDDPSDSHELEPGVSYDYCAAIYHELAHVLKALQYASDNIGQVVPGTNKPIDPFIADQSVQQQCTEFDEAFGSNINVQEVFALTRENEYRDSVPGLDLRTSHDSNGLESLPPPGVQCDIPIPIEPLPPDPLPH